MTITFVIESAEYRASKFYFNQEPPIEVSLPMSQTMWQKPSYTGYVLEIEPVLAVDLYHLLKAGVELSINNNGVAYKGVITGVKGGIPFTQICVKITP